MKKLLITITILFSTQAFALTLEDALIHSYHFNPELSAARSSLKATDEKLYQALSGFMPTISATGTKGGKSAKDSSNWTGGHVNTRSVGISQPLFNSGGTIASIQQARHEIESGRASLKIAEQAVLFNTISSYMDVIEADEMLKISSHNLKVLSEHLDSTRKKMKLGSATSTDVAQSEARYSEALTNKILAEGNVETRKANFLKTVGIEPSGLVIPTAELVQNIPNTQFEALEIARKNSPNISQADENLLASKKSELVAASTLLPSASLEANYTKAKDTTALSNSSRSKSAIFQVTIPLYQSGSEYSKIRQARNTSEYFSNIKADTLNQVTKDVVSAWTHSQTARASLKSATATVNANEAALRGVREEFKVGAKSNLDVLDAEQEAFQARLGLIKAKTGIVISLYELLEKMGTMDAKSLNLPTKLYDPTKYYDRNKFKLIGL